MTCGKHDQSAERGERGERIEAAIQSVAEALSTSAAGRNKRASRRQKTSSLPSLPATEPFETAPSRQDAPSIPPPPARTSSSGATRHKWDKADIRRARKKKLPPILKDRGYPLRPMPNGNFLVEELRDLVVKEHYWIWNSRDMKGNAIDFLMMIECRSFSEAMEILEGYD